MPATVRRHEAEAEAPARAVRFDTVVGPLWKAARQWTAALVLALFPILFIVDARVELPLSPVLPGLLLLFLVLVGLPFLLVEAWSRRYLRKDSAWQERRAAKAVRSSRSGLIVAGIWLLVWFAVGT